MNAKRRGISWELTFVWAGSHCSSGLSPHNGLDLVAPLSVGPLREQPRDVACELAKCELLGPGIVGRVVARVQRQYIVPRMSHKGVGVSFNRLTPLTSQPRKIATS
jgi:hypothetical protein